MSRARFVWLFGVALLLAGFVPVLVFCAGSLLPDADASSLLGLFPQVPWLGGAESWLHARRIRWAPSPGLLCAVPGLLLMMLGAAIARWQHGVLDAMQGRREDAWRRRRQYGAMDRIEPTLN